MRDDEVVIAGVAWSLIDGIDAKLIREKIDRAKRRGDRGRAGQLRTDLWVLNDLRAGIVPAGIPESEVGESMERLVAAIFEDEVFEMEEVEDADVEVAEVGDSVVELGVAEQADTEIYGEVANNTVELDEAGEAAAEIVDGSEEEDEDLYFDALERLP